MFLFNKSKQNRRKRERGAKCLIKVKEVMKENVSHTEDPDQHQRQAKKATSPDSHQVNEEHPEIFCADSHKKVDEIGKSSAYYSNKNRYHTGSFFVVFRLKCKRRTESGGRVTDMQAAQSIWSVWRN
eukprot:gene4115-2961_t